jgi:hypothetical protein
MPIQVGVQMGRYHDVSAIEDQRGSAIHAEIGRAPSPATSPSITAAARAVAATPPVAIKALGEALTAWQRVINAAALFPPEHPAIHTCAQACEAIWSQITAAGTVRIGVTPDTFVLADARADSQAKPVRLEETDGLRDLASRLNTLLVAGIEIGSGFKAATIIQVSDELVRCTREPPKPAVLAERIGGLSGGSLKLLVLSVSGLSFGEGARSADSNNDPQAPILAVKWDDLLSLVIEGPRGKTENGPSGASTPELQALADEMSAMIARADGESLHTLRAQLRMMLAPRPDEDLAGQVERASRVRALMAGLSPDARRSLTIAQGSDSTEALRFLVEFGEALPTADVLAVLESLGEQKQQVGSEPVRLFRMLAHSHSRTRDEAKVFAQAFEQWSPADPQATGDLRDALHEILRDTAGNKYTPEHYQSTLEDAANSIDRAQAPTGHLKQTADQGRSHAAEIAGLLLRAHAKPGWCPIGLVRVMGAGIESALEAGFARELRVCIETARVLASAQTGAADSPAGPHARVFLDRFSSPEILQAMLAASRRGDDPEHVAWLLGESGPPLLRSMLEDAACASDDADLTALVAKVNTDELLAWLAQWQDGNIEAAIRLVRAAHTLPAHQSKRLYERALASADPRLRREAILAWTRGGTAWTEELALRAIDDPDHEMQRLSIEGLRETREPWAATMLAGYLTGRHGPEKPLRSNFVNAASILASAGPAQRQMLAAVLEFLCWRVGSPRARLGACVTQALEKYRDEPEPRRALSRWWRSPARLIVKLQGPDTKDGRAAA